MESGIVPFRNMKQHLQLEEDDTGIFLRFLIHITTMFLKKVKTSRSYQSSAWTEHSTVWDALLSVCYKFVKTLIEEIETSIVYEIWYLFAFLLRQVV